MAEGLSSPIFLKYLEIYEKNPRSRVFAPLAEHYRQVGMLERAIDILKAGIKAHPSYVMGHLGLAFCYYDQRQFNHVYNILKPLLPLHRDNIRLQRLFAKNCLEIGKLDEALDVFKYLLFLNPRDHESAELVKYLEKGELAKVLKEHEAVPFEDEEKALPSAAEVKRAFEIENLEASPLQDAEVDGWRRVDLTKMIKAAVFQEEEKKKEEPKDNIFKLETNQQFVEKNFGKQSSQEILTPKSVEIPFMTHTIVDLYCSQGHLAKAVEILEKMLELNPHDEKTVQKLKEVTSLMTSTIDPLEEKKKIVKSIFEEPVQAEENISFSLENPKIEEKTPEETGRQELMELLNQKLQKAPSRYYDLVEEKMNGFLSAIQSKAQAHKNEF